MSVALTKPTGNTHASVEIFIRVCTVREGATRREREGVDGGCVRRRRSNVDRKRGPLYIFLPSRLVHGWSLATCKARQRMGRLHMPFFARLTAHPSPNSPCKLIQ